MEPDKYDNTEDVSFKSLFIPFTSTKAISFLVILGLIVYANALFNGFIGDDNGQILDNQLVHSISNFFAFFSGGSFSGGSTTGTGIYYKPMLSIVFSAIYSSVGAQPFFFHFVQLLLHITNAALVFLIMKRFLTTPFAFFVALIFLIHPINAEAVVYISDMQEVLFFFFGICALFLAMKKNLSLRRIAVIYMLLLLSLLSKETGVLFLCITFIYTFIYNKNNILPAIISSGIVVVIYSILRFGVAGIFFNKDILNPIMEASFAERLLSMPAIFSYYISTFFFPKELLFNQQWVIQQLDYTNFFLPLLSCSVFLVLFLTVIWNLSLKNKTNKSFLFFFSVWFFSGIILHLQLFPLDATVADRWFYFPIIGISGILALFLQTLYERLQWQHKREIAIVVLLIIVTLLSVRTMIRNTNWSTPVALYTHDLPLMRPNFSIENALAYEYFKQHEVEKAIVHAERSVALYATFVNLTNLGALYVESGDYEKGMRYYQESIDRYPKYYLPYENMALLLLKQDNIKDAKTFTEKATETFPGSKKLWFYRIVAEYKSEDYKSALYVAEKYHLLSNTEQSYGILVRLQNKQPLNIEIR